MGDRDGAHAEVQGSRLMNVKTRIYVRFLAVFALIGGVGIAATVYTLVHQRVPIGVGDTFTVRAQFDAANGVVSGLGQPVNVVGVKVGQVSGARLRDGRALVTMQIERDKLARVYANARAVLAPITPLQDMQINLDPGTPAAGPLQRDATIRIGQTSTPVQLSELLSTLDTNRRDFLTTLINSVGEGTAGRGHDIRRILRALGPTASDVGAIGRELALRRAELSRLVHNLAVVTRAASRDRQLAAVVAAGNTTLDAIAVEEPRLRDAIVQFPPTLSTARSTLNHLEPFAKQLRPTLETLTPAIRRLPDTLKALTPFAAEATRAIKEGIRPLVDDAQPLIRELRPAVANLTGGTPLLSRSFQVLEYFTNELAYVPDPNGRNRGFLFWLDWFVHNWNSVTSFADANGGIGRASILANCWGIQGMKSLQRLLGVVGVCPD
jgi:phospholipid/cholesterol/gamma-HCH transport system substrate-binding protein